MALAGQPGCSDSSADNGGKLTGTYSGPFTAANGMPPSGTLTWKVTQNLDQVRGTYSSSDGTSGTITASISAGQKDGEGVISGEIDETTKGCFASFIVGGTITSSAKHVEGSYNGNNCLKVAQQTEFKLDLSP